MERQSVSRFARRAREPYDLSEERSVRTLYLHRSTAGKVNVNATQRNQSPNANTPYVSLPVGTLAP